MNDAEMTVQEALQQAITHHQSQRWSEAERLYRAILEVQPQHPDANHNLGVLVLQLNKPESALSYLKAALEINPGHLQFWRSYLGALLAADRVIEARTALDAASGKLHKDDAQGLRADFERAALARSESTKPDSASGHPDATKLLGAAVQHHQRGELREAELLYRRILESDQNHCDALHLFGVLMHQRGNNEQAIAMIQAAIALNERSATFHANLGSALQSDGRLDEAIASFEEALALSPDLIGARYNLAYSLHRRGSLSEAISTYEQVVLQKPEMTDALYNLANALRDAGRLAEAASRFEQLLRIKPDCLEALSNLGNILVQQGAIEAAAARYQEALRVDPSCVEALVNLGNLLMKQDQLDAASAHYERALAAKPDFAPALCGLGNIFLQKEKLDEASSFYRQAIASDPQLPEAVSNLGATLQRRGMLSEAIRCYEEVLAIKPDLPETLYNLGRALDEQAKGDEALAYFEAALKIKPDDMLANSNLAWLTASQPNFDADDHLTRCARWESHWTKRLTATNDRADFTRRPLRGRRLRVGYVSGDFRRHAVSYFVEQLFACHDRNRVELFAYPTVPESDDVTARICASVDHWVPLHALSASAACKRIRNDQIDVLIDLSGWTRGNRLDVFTLRAAPVQAHYLGFFASTGLSQMDYWIGDEVLTPTHTDAQFREAVWRIPRVWVSYHAKEEAPVPSWCPDPKGRIRFGSFNRLAKLTPQTIELWSRILIALPEADLILKTVALADPETRGRMLDSFAGHGIVADRIVFIGSDSTLGWQQHMACYGGVDIALDPVGAVGGGTTSCDALWMGVPLVTLAGDRMPTRMTASMLRAIGRPEWIAQDADDYMGKTIALAQDVEGRKALRFGQRARMAASPLCDTAGLAGALEAAFFAMFERAQTNSSGVRERDAGRETEAGAS
jgi:protein O-GlcNAc transferase